MPSLSELSRRIAEYAGLDPPEWVLLARAKERAARAGLDLDGYVARLGSDGAELEALTEALRVGETRFFRHKAQVEALRRHAIPERIAQGREKLRAWSAGCATGEEAWTLAMLLAEAGRPFEVIGTDLSDGALATARAARYPAASAAEVPAATRARFLVEEAGAVTIAAALRERVRFERRNLLDAGYPQKCDVILCRNVLIYFDGARRDEVIARLAESLLPGGYLFLGYSETLRAHEELFESIREGEWVVYRRRSEPAAVIAPVRVPVSVPVPAPAAVPERKRTSTVKTLPPMPRPQVVRLHGSYDGERAARLTAELKPVIAGEAHTIDLDGAAFLGDEAARILRRVAEAAEAPIRLRASRFSTRRWLLRHGLDTRFVVEGGAAP